MCVICDNVMFVSNRTKTNNHFGFVS